MTTEAYWSLEREQLLTSLASCAEGLPRDIAQARQLSYAHLRMARIQGHSWLHLVWRQLNDPLVILLLMAGVISGILQDWTDSLMILLIVASSACIGFWREYRAAGVLEKLTQQLRLTTPVLRGGESILVAHEDLVPGDVIILSPGKLVPADAVLLEDDQLFINQAVLTGESFPVQKQTSPHGLPTSTALAQRSNCVFLGSHVRSGHGKALVVRIGRETAYGQITQQVTAQRPETAFEQGLRGFGYLLLRVMLIIVIIVFGAQALRGNTGVQSLMFAVALAVGLSPELLPAILSINLSSSAQRMARAGLLVQRLNAIENLGSIDVLCTDKTGTLTEGVLEMQGCFDADNQPSPAVRLAAAWNARLQTGLANPLDDAILASFDPPLEGIQKQGELPYDFTRKRLSVMIRDGNGVRLICKGAFDAMIRICRYQKPGVVMEAAGRQQLQTIFEQWSQKGYRVLAVADKQLPLQPGYTLADEIDLTFLGFIVFADRPKPGVDRVLKELHRLGVAVKIITGDNAVVSRQVAEAIGMRDLTVMTGAALEHLQGVALQQQVQKAQVFAEVDPSQKERIVKALRNAGRQVAYMGDGINDLPALHAADASISVEGAVDAAKSTADFIFMQKDLSIVLQGVLEGRRTFANTMKYLLMTTSANLGNMVSMAVASLSLPFLPLLASQVLLNNFLSDIPAISLGQDTVDPELVQEPRRWDLRLIQRFMLAFGLLSSCFDILTFIILMLLFQASAETFRTAWFLESLLSEVGVALILRTRRRVYQSRPHPLLLFASIIISVLAVLLALLPGTGFLGFTALSPLLFAAMLGVTFAYLIATEILKTLFFRWTDRQSQARMTSTE